MTDANAARWLRGRGELASPRVRLLCFPYAGAGASVFHGWYSKLPSHVDVRAVQLPGRQDRIGEKPLTRLADMIGPIERALSMLPDAPLMLFGHSFGGILAFELARRLERQSRPVLALIASAAQGPGTPRRQKPAHTLTDGEFLHAIHERYATPWSILQDRDLMSLALPSLRSDLEALETYVYDGKVPLRAPIAILRGLRDEQMTDADVAAWRQVTSGATVVHDVDAGHFFVDSHPDWVIERLQSALDAWSAVADGDAANRR
jgi:surfactin synthase thioesterase subunit